ncbi:MAG: GNAT family N-acetyltransferase [Thermomicrobiales bacterium]
MAQLVMQRPHLRGVPAARPLPTGYTLRQAGAADEPALAETLTAAFGETWTPERVRRELTGAPEVRAVYVIDHGGYVVATASSRVPLAHFPGAGCVHWVATHPDHTRRGLGQVLLIRLLRDFAERGEAQAVLQTDDFRLPAIRAYLQCGFVPIYAVRDEDHRERWSAIFQQMFQRGLT